MPHWICDKCGTRLYSASESLKWRDCPVCTGKLAIERDDEAPRFGRKRDEGTRTAGPRAGR